MITIPMKTGTPLDQGSLSTLNKPVITGILTAQTIETLNKQCTRNGSSGHTLDHQPSRNTTSAAVSADSRKNRETPPRQNPSAAVPPRSSHMPQRSVPHTPKPLPSSSGTTSSGTTSAPAQKKLPALKNPVQKGQKAVLSADKNLPSIRACFGWNTTNPHCDVDVSAFLLDAGGKVPGDSWFVFYGQTVSPDQSTRFHVSDSTDREFITIDFTKLNRNVKKIVFVLTINEAFEKRLHFGMMKDAYIRILDPHNTELVSFKMTDYYSNVISMMIGEIYEYNGTWKFNAVGNGVAKDLAGLCALYGVQISD